MLFNSYIYLYLFLPFFFVIFFFIENKFVNRVLILIANLIFYSWLNYKFIFIITFSVIINYVFSTYLIKDFKQGLVLNKKKILLIAIIFNILVLIFFKYLDFFIQNINYVFDTNIIELNLPFPLALSFFTLQQITFLVNCYDRQIIKVKFLDYFNYVSFFPQLIAGPIVLFKEINFNLNVKKRKIDFLNIYKGIYFIIIGLFKKTIISDKLFNVSNYGFTNVDNITFLDSWVATIAFSFQLYFDFSGYVDMAIGSALLFNIKLPINFNSPFKSVSIIDFWKRWHITLSNFITNYMYFPLVKYFENKYFFNIFSIIIVMTIAGIWHGPRWTYLFFGLMHGLALAFNNLFRFKINNFLSIFLTFLFVNFSFVFFNSKTVNQSLSMFSKMLNPNTIGTNYNLIHFGMLLFTAIIIFFFKNSNYLFKIKPSYKNTFFIIILFVLCVFNLDEKRFIYFDF